MKNEPEPIIGMTVGDGVIPMTVVPVVAPKPKADQGEK